MKKVSVIIPTYKRSENLVRAINSVLNQTYSNIEVIVVDDNDENSEYRWKNENSLKNYIKDGSIVYLKHRKNQNGAAARNTGLKKCTGDYITFLDDDDVFIKTRIEKMVKLLDLNPQFSFAYSSVAISQYGRIMDVVRANKKGKMQFEVLCQQSFFGTGSNMFFRKEAIDVVGLFDERFVRHQDMEYMVRFFRFGKAVPLDEILVVKCIEDASNLPNYDVLRSMKELFLLKFKEDIKKYGSEDQKRIYYCNYYELLLLFPDRRIELMKVIDDYGTVSWLSCLKNRVKRFYNGSEFMKKLATYVKSMRYICISKKLDWRVVK